MIEALHIQVTGIVQGVGFRPFVYRLAKRYVVSGWVLNAIDGVTIHAEAESNLLDQFVLALTQEAPAAARVKEVSLREVPLEGFESFEIRFSNSASVKKSTLISPDLATCDKCLRELFNPTDRRFRYPFINCTNCGPRFTITAKLPYDRAHTSMTAFEMCRACATEYTEPNNRRFHAQPNACFSCGPQVSWIDRRTETSGVLWGSTRESSDEIISRAVSLLCEGGILALKGLGGFHLACDAHNAQAVARLRTRKRRFDKPFAVMMRDLAVVRQFCKVSDEEAAILTGSERPIVLLTKRKDTHFVPKLADGLAELGVMLPYTPLQHLIFNDLAVLGISMLVMTSGNVHDEPIIIDDTEAQAKLTGIADAILGNNRPILARYDDSVVRIIKVTDSTCALQVIRRARGLAPTPLLITSIQTSQPEIGESEDTAGQVDVLPSVQTPAIFAAGSEQKNTLCLVRGGEFGESVEAFVSQYIGDREHAETDNVAHDVRKRYETLFDITPTVCACDMHPEYLPSKEARIEARRLNIPLVEVQHHHAHVVSAMVEHGIEGPVIGFAFDGSGYGVDGAIWGGEVLLANTSDFERFANFAYVPMPGGAAAITYPLRMAYGVLWAFDLLDHPQARRALVALGDASQTFERMIETGLNTPVTSSVGRLFDAAAALLGVCTEARYEGEPAMMLEAIIEADAPDNEPNYAVDTTATYTIDKIADHHVECYEIALKKNVATIKSTAHDTSVLMLDAAPAFKSLLDDSAAGVSTACIARRFHNAFIGAIVASTQAAHTLYDIDTVVLSGGVFMNRYLVERTSAALSVLGYTVVLNRDLPPNDGCISFGQAVVAHRRLTCHLS